MNILNVCWTNFSYNEPEYRGRKSVDEENDSLELTNLLNYSLAEI